MSDRSTIGKFICPKTFALAMCVVAAVVSVMGIAFRQRWSNSEGSSRVVVSRIEPTNLNNVQNMGSESEHQPPATPEPPRQPTPSTALASAVTDSFEIQIQKDGYEPKLLDRFEKYGQDAIVAFEGATGERSRAEAKALATRLKELSIISAEPLPRVSANVRVPPGPGPSWSGMSPSDIKDPERRKAYVAARQQNAVDNKKRSWLIQAQSTHSLLVIHLDFALTRMRQAGTITAKEADEVLLLSRGEQP